MPSVEDIDLGMRLHATGAKIRLDPLLQGCHLKRWRLSSMIATDFARRGVPWVQLQLAARRAPATLNLGWQHRTSTLLVLVAVTSAPRHRALAAAAGAGFVTLNRSLYAVLHRKGGARLMAGGIALHALHYLIGAAAVPTAAVGYARAAVRSRP
jgi:hypothetical protein